MRKPWSARVSRVYDGDTFVTEDDDHIRLARFDAAETGQAGSIEATGCLHGLVGGKVVEITPVGKSYGRWVAEVVVGRVSVNDTMIRRIQRR